LGDIFARYGVLKPALEAIQRLFADEALPLAGNIAFRALFSLFPFLIFLTSLAGLFGNASLADEIVSFLLSAAPAEVVKPLATEIHNILTVPRTGLLGASLLITVWSAMAGVDSVRVALNRAYNVLETRGYIRLFLLELAFIVASAIVLLTLAILIVILPVVFAVIERYAPGVRETYYLLDLARYPVAMVLLAGGLLLCHRLLPNHATHTRDVFPGVLLTVAVWIALSGVYSYYLVNFDSFASTYASLSGIFAALFFLYLAAIVLILGGEINRVLALYRLRRPSA
jgi:membrane protein